MVLLALYTTMEREIQNIKNWLTNSDIDKASIRNELTQVLNRLAKIEEDLRLKTSLIKAFQDSSVDIRSDIAGLNIALSRHIDYCLEEINRLKVVPAQKDFPVIQSLTVKRSPPTQIKPKKWFW